LGLFVGVLWLRFGSDTGDVDPDTGKPYRSGTEAEFKTAYRLRQASATGWPKVMFYRCTRTPSDLLYFDVPGNEKQFARVKKFFAQCKPKGAHPEHVMPYGPPEDFERLVREHQEKCLWEYADLHGLIPSAESPSHPEAQAKAASKKGKREQPLPPALSAAETARWKEAYLRRMVVSCNALPLAALGGEEGADQGITLDRVYNESIRPLVPQWGLEYNPHGIEFAQIYRGKGAWLLLLLATSWMTCKRPRQDSTSSSAVIG
jgi:hypothetical protein